MQVVILNNDKKFLDQIKNEIYQIDPLIEVVVYNDATKFLEDFELFLDYSIFIVDILFYNENGIELAKKINNQINGAQIIFVSNYVNVISEIYETKHCYFIYKPSLEKYLFKALKRAINNIRESKNNILINCRGKKIVISLSEIIYFERDLRRTIIHLNNTQYYTYDKFQSFLDLVPDNFFECHRSFIVNFNEVREHQRNRFILKNNVVIPISRSHEKQAKDAFENYLMYSQ